VAFAARDALQERDVQRRLALAGRERADARPDLLAVPLERPGVLAAAAVEQGDRRTRIEAQHAREVQPGLLGDADALARDERLPDEYARQAHASSTPSVAIVASVSISPGEIT